MTSFQGKLKIRHLEVVLSVADCGNLSRAATQLGMTQSGLSRAIAEIEELAGGRLFERTPRGMACTALGLSMCRHAGTLLGQFRKAEADLAAISGGDLGSLTIGCFSMFSGWPLADAVQAFRAKHPQVTLTIQIGTHERLIKDLDAADIDVLISRYTPGLDPQAYRSLSLLDDAIVMGCAPKHPLAEKKKVTLADCVAFPWITPLPGSRLRAELYALIKANQLVAPDMVGALSPEFGREMVAGGDYLWLLPGSVAAVMRSKGDIHVLPVDVPLRRSPMAAIWRRDRPSTREVRAFSAVLSRVIKAEKALENH
ncbi:MAG: LysR family transcriptional regulator [Pseudomonadota bacterium]